MTKTEVTEVTEVTKMEATEVKKDTAIIMFKEKSIRRVWHEEEWCFSVVDVCAALTGSNDAGVS